MASLTRNDNHSVANPNVASSATNLTEKIGCQTLRLNRVYSILICVSGDVSTRPPPGVPCAPNNRVTPRQHSTSIIPSYSKIILRRRRNLRTALRTNVGRATTHVVLTANAQSRFSATLSTYWGDYPQMHRITTEYKHHQPNWNIEIASRNLRRDKWHFK